MASSKPPKATSSKKKNQKSREPELVFNEVVDHLDEFSEDDFDDIEASMAYFETTSHVYLDRAEKLAKLLDQHQLNEISLEDSVLTIRLVRYGTEGAPQVRVSRPSGSYSEIQTQPSTTNSGTVINLATKASGSNPSESHNIKSVRSPFVGTFYSSPSPDASPFVKIGDRVQKGQTLCIIEAMKLMNEIEAPFSGIVRHMHAENGKAVQFDDELFKVEVDA